MALDGMTIAIPEAAPAVGAGLAEPRRPLGRRRSALRPAETARPAPARDGAAETARQAAVLAHDLNNLVGVVLCASEALVAQFPEGSEQRELAELSQGAAEQAGELLRRLGDLSAPPAAGAACDAAEAVLATVRRVRLAAPRAVAVEVGRVETPLRCAADRAELEGALLNLSLNAVHALAGGGRVVVSAQAQLLGLEAAMALDLEPGAWMALTVADDGPGMSSQVLARATEPYFTTRAGRGGTGLGLSGVDAFARRSGGRLRLQSEEGRGLTATLYLPLG